MLDRTIGKYRIVERIGRGGMGTVYKAIDETLHREVAVKVLNPDLAERDVVRRFHTEAMMLARLNHPGIATLYELFRTDDDLLMVMEFVRGETFDRIVERSGPLAPSLAANLGAQVLDALGHAHRVGIVHRDLKPANLMLTEHGTVKIMDFGIARVLGAEHLTLDGLMMGTPAYMAPEQVLATDVDARADLYSIGVVLYRLFSGNLPFTADTAIAMAHKQLKDPPTPLRQFRAELPEWCEEVLDRALAKSPADRFQTAEEFRDALIGHGASLVPAPIAVPAVAVDSALAPDHISTDLSEPLVPASTSPAATDEKSQEAAYAPTMPVTAAAGADMPRPSSSSPTNSTTVILQRQHLALAGGLFTLLMFAIGGLAFVVLRRPAVPVSATDNGRAASAEPSIPPTGATAPAPVSQQKKEALAPSLPRDRSASEIPASSGSRRSRGPRDATLPPLTIVDLRVVDADGDRVREREAILTFASGVLTVAERNGAVVRSIPYDWITNVSYSRSRRPMWQSAGGPEPVMRVGGGAFGMFRSDPHWVSIRMKDAFVVLRVEPEHIRSLPNAFSRRAGVRLEIVRSRSR